MGTQKSPGTKASGSCRGCLGPRRTRHPERPLLLWGAWEGRQALPRYPEWPEKVVVDGCVFGGAAGRDPGLSALASLPEAVPLLDKNRSNPGSGEPQ